MGFFKGLRERAARIFGRPAAPAPEQPAGSDRGGWFGGWFQRRREAREQRKREKEWERSKRRQEKMDREREEYERKKAEEEKARRTAEERAQKEADKKRREEADAKMRDTFKERWGFNDQEYDEFLPFIASFDEYMKEWIQSESLVEVFKTGRSYNISGEDIKQIIDATYNEMSGGFTAEDLIDEIYSNIEGYAQNVSEGAYV